MAKLSTEKRNQLKDSDFGIPEQRMYPLHDKAHIESAVKLFGHADRKYKKALAQKILRKAREYNMDTSGWKQVLSFASEQVPPMSDGTSIGNTPPGIMAPYNEEDELMGRAKQISGEKPNTMDMFSFAKQIVSEISAQVEKDSKPPTGNQNCQLCTWCAEARFRGMNVLPRPVYSPRDPALEIKGENIVLRPIRETFTSQRDVVERVRGAVDSRWYVHVNWKDSTGGHEFLVVNINDYAYIMDAQAGLLKEIDETDSTSNYFRDINFDNSYMVRLDNKQFNVKLFNEMNDPSKVLPFKNSLDIPYMRDNGMLSDSSDDDPRFRRVYVPSDEALKYLKSDPELSQYWEDLMKATKGEFLIDRETGEPIGHVFVHTNKKDKGFIFNLEVNPKYRRQGYGWILTDDAVRRFGGEDLTVDADNEPAIQLYLQYGFEIYKKGQWHYDPPKDEYWMKLKASKRPKPIQEQMLDGIGAATGDEEHKIPVKCPDNMSRDEKIFYRALFGEFDSSMQTDNMIEKIIWPFAQKEGLAQNAYNKLYEYCYHKKKDDATLDDVEDRFEHFDYVWGFLFPPAGGEVVSATKAYIVFDSDCTYLDKSDQTRPKDYVQFKLEITLKNNKDFFAQMVSPKTGNTVHYMTLHMKDFGDYMDERDIKKQMEQLSKEKVVEAMPEDMRRFIESINDPKFYHYPMEETGIEKVGNGLWIFDKDTIASDFLIAFKYLPEVKKLSEWGDWDKKLEILKKTLVKKLTVAVSDDIGDLYIVYDLSSGKLKETWNGKVIANSWKEFESKLKKDGTVQENAFQESTNVFESGHFSKYGAHVLGFNDEGMAVMKKCDCGGNISVSMKGEPVYTCESCGKTYGIVAYQEGALQDLKNGVNPFSDDMVFHVTADKHVDGQVWKPRVPDYLDPYNPEETGFEDNTTPRICFSTSIEGCLNGITVNLPRQNPDQFDKMYVYVPEKPWKQYKHKTNKEIVKNKLVYDANVSREVWIMEPVRMKLYGVIRVDQVSDVKRKSVVPTSKGVKGDRNYFTYKWHWVVKPKVLKKGTKFDYSPERVIDDLCIDLKKFKYGLIRNGKLQTGNVSEADYDKYWVFHSGQEVDEAGGGNCWDMVEYEAGYLEAFGVSYKKYFLNFTKTDGKTQLNTHTICVVPLNGKYVYIEQAFKRVVDEWGYERQKTFDKLNDIFDYVAECSADYEGQSVNFGVWDYTNTKIDYGTPSKEFMQIIMSGKMIYDGEASNAKEESYRMKPTRFQLIQEEEEFLSDNEDITVGDLELDDENDNPEEVATDETSSEDKTEPVKKSEEPEKIEPIENFDDINVESDEVPEYMKERLSDDEKEEFDTIGKENEEMDVNNVDLGAFGSDKSDIQNDYDPKEIEILNKLMSSEAQAMNEYMDGAKDTNVDVLRRLYADIANEERFHMEQLLYAKCEMTGEKYVPRDPDVKSEYEELLAMGMDEDTAMQTAVDKCHIKGISISTEEEDDDTKAEIAEEIETMEFALYLFSEKFDSLMQEFSMEDRDKSFDRFVQEAVEAEGQGPIANIANRNPLSILLDALSFIIRMLVKLIQKIGVFLGRIKKQLGNFKKYIQQVKRDPDGWKNFFEPISLYFMPEYGSLNGKRTAIMPRAMYQWYVLAYDTLKACADTIKQPIGFDLAIDESQFRTQNIGNNIKKGTELLNSVHLSKEMMVKPSDDDMKNNLIDMFMGYSDIFGEDGKSFNALNSYQRFADLWAKLLKRAQELLKLVTQTQTQANTDPQFAKVYDTLYAGFTSIIKSAKAFSTAISSDINTMINLDQNVYNAMKYKDQERIQNNKDAKATNEKYRTTLGD